MDVAFGIICVILLLILVLGPVLRRWFAPMLQRWMIGKMEDRVRRMAGMPTRKEERKARKRQGNTRNGAPGEAAAGKRSYGSRRYRSFSSTVGFLRYVAEDVEFTEIKEFDGDREIGHKIKVEYTLEEQIEDAEFEELPKK